MHLRIKSSPAGMQSAPFGQMGGKLRSKVKRVLEVTEGTLERTHRSGSAVFARVSRQRRIDAAEVLSQAVHCHVK